VAGNPGRFTFAHDLARRVIYDAIPYNDRLELHRRTAVVLEGAHGEQRHLEALAYHACQSVPLTDADRAIDYARRAADRAIASGAYDTAARHLRLALQVLEEHRDDGVLRAVLLLAIGTTHNRAGEVVLGNDPLLRAAQLGEQQGRWDLVLRAALEFGGRVPVAADIEDERAIELLELALANSDAHPWLRARALGRLAQWTVRRSDDAHRVALVDEALALARASGDARTLSEVLQYRYWALYGPDDTDERLGVADEIIAIGSALGDPEVELQGRQCGLHALLELGDVDAAADAERARTQLASDLHQPEFLWTVVVSRALQATNEGRFAEAEAIAREAFEIRRRIDRLAASTVYGVQLIQLRWLQGRMGELLAAHEQLVSTRPERIPWRVLVAWDAAESGDLARARHEFDRLAASDFTDVARDFDFFTTMAGLSVVCCRLTDRPRARLLLELLSPFATRTVMAGESACFGSVSHHLGGLASVIGDHELAETRFRAALAQHERMGSEPFVALTEAAWGTQLLRRGSSNERARGTQLLGAANERAGRLGMLRVARDCSEVPADQ
jgi:tetratricopeptide (TPR) repeat protein